MASALNIHNSMITIQILKRGFFFFLAFASLLAFCSAATLQDKVNTPSTDFAIRHLNTALSGLSSSGKIAIEVDEAALKPQAYRIRLGDERSVQIAGGDQYGAMYGILDLAEQIALTRNWDKIEGRERSPFIEKRGIKMNIPLGARLPSYDDTGDAAQRNIAEVWSKKFWREYLDDLARNRYNVLSLWTKHPFPGMIKLKDYPKIALDNVYSYTGDINPDLHKDWRGVDIFDPRTHKLVKQISIDEKIAFWQWVMEYAHDRGIEIFLFTWNIYVTGAEQYGIDWRDESAVGYMRECVKQFALTYPRLAGLGVTAGENMPEQIGERTNVQWLRDTYGAGIADAMKETPEREIRFIFRRHHTNLPSIERDFRPYFPGKVETSFKYSFAHMYSAVEPPRFDNEYAKDVEAYGYRCWMNLRNDDIFTFRWGNPDFVRSYLKKMATYPIAGFYMGSDGYVWGRESTTKNSELSGELENTKHWYREMLWGRLSFDPELNKQFFVDTLAARFPSVDAGGLYAAWQTASEIIPAVTRFHWKGGDSMWAPEGCLDMYGFQDVRDFIDCHVFEPATVMNIAEYVDAVLGDLPLKAENPMQVADALTALSRKCFDQVAPLTANREDASEALKETLSDIEAMAWLGQYYADKIRGATYLHLHEMSTDVSAKKRYQAKALKNLEKALPSWERYAENADARYEAQLLARTRFLDWKGLTKGAKNDIKIVEASTGELPKIAKVFYRNRRIVAEDRKKKLKETLEEHGYVYEDTPAWMLHGFAVGRRIILFQVGDLTHEEFLNAGGRMPDDFESRGFAIIDYHGVHWLVGRNAEYAGKALDAYLEEI